MWTWSSFLTNEKCALGKVIHSQSKWCASFLNSFPPMWILLLEIISGKCFQNKKLLERATTILLTATLKLQLEPPPPPRPPPPPPPPPWHRLKRIKFVWAASLVNWYEPRRELKKEGGRKRKLHSTMTFDRITLLDTFETVWTMNAWQLKWQNCIGPEGRWTWLRSPDWYRWR